MMYGDALFCTYQLNSHRRDLVCARFTLCSLDFGAVQNKQAAGVMTLHTCDHIGTLMGGAWSPKGPQYTCMLQPIVKIYTIV